MNDFMGERGATGDRGISGERGPKGDHGQHGETGATGPQGEPGKNWHLSSWALARILAFVLIAAAAFYSTTRTFENSRRNTIAIERINAERAQRIDQACRTDEGNHLSDVTKLARTYDYLVALPDVPFKQLDRITQAVILQVPSTEETAHKDPAPAYCDVTLPGGKPVGLPEPDPIIPKRPAKVARWIKEAQASLTKSGKK